MSDIPESNPGPINRFLSRPSWDGVSGVFAILSFLLSLGALRELVSSNVRVLLWLQATSLAIPALVVLLMLFFAAGAYRLFAWRTVPDYGYVENRQRTRREARYSGRSRLIAFVVMLSSLSLALIATVGYTFWLEQPSPDTVVLIADFQGPDGPDDMRVTRQIVDEIRETLEEHSEIAVRTLGWPVEDRRGEGSDDARRIGQLAKADIVIWGDYGFDPDLAVYVHFDLLNEPQPILERETYRILGDEQVQAVAAARAELAMPKTVAFSIALGEHLGTLVAFASGLALLENKAYAEAAKALDTASQVYGNPLAKSIEPLIHFMRANSYLWMGDLQIPIVEYTAALELLDDVAAQSIALAPETILVNRGNARRDLGDLTGAISDYDRAIALDPQDVAAYNNRGNARRAQGDLTGAISDYDQAIAFDPQFAGAYYNRGNARRDQGDLTGAISDYDQAIALDLQFAGAYYNRGNVRRDLGNLTGAISDYDQAIALDPQDVAAYNNRGNARSFQGDLTGAISDYDQAIALDPQDADAYVNRGVARRDLGDLTGAISDYDQAIALDPEYATAYVNRGNARRDLGDLTGAISDYDQAIAFDPQFAGAYNNRGNARRDLGDLTGAISDYDQAIALDPQDADAYVNRGVARRDLGDLTGAISDYDQAIALDPEDADAYVNRGIARRDLGALTGAISDYDQAIALDPQDADAYNNRGIARRDLGDLTGAISDYDQAINFDPHLAVAYNNRGIARRAQGNPTGAISDFTRYLELSPAASNRSAVEQTIAELTAQLNGQP